MTTVEIKLPDLLAEEARAAGLLTPEAIESMVLEAMRQYRVNRLFDARKRLRAANIPPMTAEEIQAEIRAARDEARRAAGS